MKVLDSSLHTMFVHQMLPDAVSHLLNILDVILISGNRVNLDLDRTAAIAGTLDIEKDFFAHFDLRDNSPPEYPLMFRLSAGINSPVRSNFIKL